jgi:predicted transposase YbfD/YdcC
LLNEGQDDCGATFWESIEKGHDEAEFIANAARGHWKIENVLHWRLDVIFGQDRSRYRDRNGAQNLAICRKLALNLLQKETSLKRGIATKQAAAIANPRYREKVLKNLF